MNNFITRRKPWLGMKQQNPYKHGWQHWTKYAQWVTPVGLRRKRKKKTSLSPFTVTVEPIGEAVPISEIESHANFTGNRKANYFIPQRHIDFVI